MKVVKINTATGGIVYTDGRISLLEGKEAIIQNLTVFFRIAKGEYFLNQEYGIEYFNTGYTTQDNKPLFDSQVKLWLSKKSWIKSITGYKSSFASNILTVTIDTINTEDGNFKVGDIVI